MTERRKKDNTSKILINKQRLIMKVEKILEGRKFAHSKGAFGENEWSNFGDSREIDGIRTILNVIKKERADNSISRPPSPDT